MKNTILQSEYKNIRRMRSPIYQATKRYQFALQDWRDSNPRLLAWQASTLTNWATILQNKLELKHWERKHLTRGLINSAFIVQAFLITTQYNYAHLLYLSVINNRNAHYPVRGSRFAFHTLWLRFQCFKLVSNERFERSTLWSQTRCSTRLS